MKVGVFLARMQPVHNGHLAMIKKMMDDGCARILILLGSADKLNARNPIPITFREEMLKEALGTMIAKDPRLAHFSDKITIVCLPDLTSEADNSHDWGFYLYNAIVQEIEQHYFTLYYSDGYEIITQWFPSFLFTNSIDLRLVARNNCEKGISATKVRELIMSDSEELQNVVPANVYAAKDILKAFLSIFKQ